MLDLSEVANSPELAETYTILRSTGTGWNQGVWETQEQQLTGFGVISVADAKEVEMVPEGDVAHGAMVFWSAQPIYVTNTTNTVPGQSSDILIWNGKQYRVLSVRQYLDWGYYRAVGTRMQAD